MGEQSELLWILSKKMWEWKAANKVHNFGINPFPHVTVVHCAYILGYADTTDMVNNWTPRSSQLIKQMLGKHGLTIYKALLAKANDREEQKHGEK